MFITPQWTTLWERYSRNLLEGIEEIWWKLALLKIISQDSELVGDIREKTWIHVWSLYVPVNIGWKYINEGEKNQLWEKINQLWNRDIVTDNLMLRLSIAWDYRSLVDVFPSPLINRDSSIDNINRLLETTFNELKQKEGGIKRYAEWTWVPYDLSDISVWIVPEFNAKITTVTENINNDTIFIDSCINKGRNWWGAVIRTENHSSETHINIWEKVRKMLEILQSEKYWILDSSIAYQFEIWCLSTGQLILLQVKEFARKTTPTSVSSGLNAFNNRIMSSVTAWEINIPLIYSLDSSKWFEKIKKIREDIALVLWTNDRSLNITDYDPNVVAFFHADSHWWSMTHNAFRMVQAVLQKGWIACLWWLEVKWYWDQQEETAMIEQLREDNTTLRVSTTNSEVYIKAVDNNGEEISWNSDDWEILAKIAEDVENWTFIINNDWKDRIKPPKRKTN